MNHLLSLCLTLFLTIGLAGCGSGHNEAELLASAEQFMADGDLRAAMIQLKSALQENPDNGQARLLLGKLYLESGETANAAKELQRAIELGAPEGEVLPLLGSTMLAARQYEELQAISLDNLATDEQKATVLALQGQAKLVEGDRAGATILIDNALEFNPQSTEAQLAKTRLLLTGQELATARSRLESILASQPTNSEAWSLQGDLEVAQGNLEKADADYSKAIEGRGNHFPELLKRASLRVMSDQYELAQEDVDTLKKLAPTHPDVNYIQGQLQFRANQYPAAIESFTLATNAAKPNILANYFLAAAHYRMGNMEQAQRYGELFLKDLPGSVGGRKLLATVTTSMGQYDRVAELIAPVLAADPEDTEALNLLAIALLQTGKTDEGIETLKTVVDLEPESALALFRLGQALTEAGQLPEGAVQFRQALETDPDFNPAYTALTDNLFRQNQPQQALDVASDYQRAHPDDPAPYNLLGLLYWRAGNKEEALAAFDKVLAISPGNPTANHHLASAMIVQKEYAKARGHYQAVLAASPDELSTLLQLAALDMLESDEEAMAAHLKQAVDAHPDAIQPRIQLAGYYLRTGHPARATDLVAQIREPDRSTPPVLRTSALAQIELRDYAGAQNTLQRWIMLQPNSAEAHFLLAQAYSGMKNWELTERELEQALTIAPRYQAAVSAYARILLARQNIKGFEQQLSLLRELAPEHPDTLRLEAALASSQGDPASVTKLLDEAFTKQASTENMLALVKQRWQTGDREGALLLHQSWVEDNPQDLAASMALAGTYLQLDDPDRAIGQYLHVLSIAPNNALAMNNLAWSLRKQDPEKALAYAKNAVEIAPKFAEGWDTMAVILLDSGEAREAKRSIEKALSIAPDYPGILYHSAMIDEALGDTPAAVATLTSLVSSGRSFPEKASAEALLTTLRQ